MEFPKLSDIEQIDDMALALDMFGTTEGDDPEYFRGQRLPEGFVFVDDKFIPITEGPEVLL